MYVYTLSLECLSPSHRSYSQHVGRESACAAVGVQRCFVSTGFPCCPCPVVSAVCISLSHLHLSDPQKKVDWTLLASQSLPPEHYVTDGSHSWGPPGLWSCRKCPVGGGEQVQWPSQNLRWKLEECWSGRGMVAVIADLWCC